MANDSLIPQYTPPDYTKTSTGKPFDIPENYQKDYSSPALIDKVRRKIIKGRIDGN